MRLGVGAALVEGRWIKGDVEIHDGVVADVGLGVGLGGGPASARRAVPGFVELQVNGVDDVDFLDTDPDGFARAARALAATGVTSFAPTLVTSPPERVEHSLADLAAAHLPIRSLGAHLEGPFLAPGRLGAHDPRWRRDPDPALLERLLAAGHVASMTLAPELPGAFDAIDTLVAGGVCVSLGHSDADGACAHGAFDRGARTVTHLFNAMSWGSHRSPGLAMAALARPDVTVTLILDGVHVGSDAATVAWHAARGRVALVTDRVPHSHGEVAPDGAVRTGDTLAGSTTTMPECIRALVGLGASETEAVVAATAVPARALGRDDIGQITIGDTADVVVVDEAFEVLDTLVAGRSAL